MVDSLVIDPEVLQTFFSVFGVDLGLLVGSLAGIVALVAFLKKHFDLKGNWVILVTAGISALPAIATFPGDPVKILAATVAFTLLACGSHGEIKKLLKPKNVAKVDSP